MDLKENDKKKLEKMRETLQCAKVNLQQKTRLIEIEIGKLTEMSEAKKIQRMIFINIPEENRGYLSIFGNLYPIQSPHINQFKSDTGKKFNQKVKITAFYQQFPTKPIGIMTEDGWIFVLDQDYTSGISEMWKFFLGDDDTENTFFLEIIPPTISLKWTDTRNNNIYNTTCLNFKAL